MAKTRAFKALPSVSGVRSVFSLLPENHDEKIALLHSLQFKIPEIHPTALENKPSDLREFADILERIRFKLQDDQAERWGAEKPLVGQMARSRALALDIIETLRYATSATVCPSSGFQDYMGGAGRFQRHKGLLSYEYAPIHSLSRSGSSSKVGRPRDHTGSTAGGLRDGGLQMKD
jgi:hypothetical protein